MKQKLRAPVIFLSILLVISCVRAFMPSVHAATGTFGYTSIGSTQIPSVSSETGLVCGYHDAPNCNGTVNSISAYVCAQSGTVDLIGALYTYAGPGTPGTLIANTSEITIGTTPQWNNMTFPSPPRVTAGTQYWIVWWQDGWTYYWYNPNIASGIGFYILDCPGFPDFPNTFSGVIVSSSAQRSIYVTYTILEAYISPASATLDVGQSQLVNSSVSGGSAPYTYEWYRNGTLVSGVTNSSWTWRPASPGYYTMYLKAKDSAGYTATSNTASFTVDTAPTCSITPTTVTMDTGQSQTFTASASGGTTSYSYYWYLDGSPVGSNSPTYTYTASSGTHSIYVNVTDSASVPVTVESNTATVTVNSAPSVTISPTSWIMDVGQSETFTASASFGSGTLHYKWYLNGGAVGSDSPNYQYKATSAGAYSLYVNVTDSASVPVTVKSNTATITVNATVTFAQIGASSDFTGTVVTIDGTSYGVSQLPISFYWALGSKLSFAFQSTLVVTANGKQYVWTSTTGLTSVQSGYITITTNGTILGNYKTQYYLTLQTSPSSVNTPSGAGWYNAGTYASISTPQDVAILAGSSRYDFRGWQTTDMSEITNASAASTTVLMDSGKTVTVDYVTQYYVTFGQSGVGSDFAGTVVTIDGAYYGKSGVSFWWDANSVHTFSFASPLAVNDGKQYVWTSTSGLTSLQNDPLTVTSSGSVTGDYKTQYYVTFDETGVGTDFTGTVVTIDGINYSVNSLPVSFWYDSGSSHSFSYASPLTVDSIKQYVWNTTSGLSTLQHDPLTVTASGSIVGNYFLQNAVTFDQLGIGSDFTGTVVTIDGTSYGVSQLPVSFYWTVGSMHSFAFQSPLVVTANGEQYVWTGTTGLVSEQSGMITVTTYGSIVGNYTIQYYLALQTSPSGVNAPSGAGWYNAGTYASISTPQDVAILAGSSRYDFRGWTTTDTLEITSPSSASTTVYMDQAKTVTANYVTQYYLTVVTSPSGVNGPTGEGWYDAGSYASISTPQDVAIVAGSSRYDFRGWTTTDMSEITDPSAASTTMLMDGAKTATANYATQYYITVESAHDTPTTSAWVDEGGSFTASVTSPTEVVSGDHQWVCNGFSIDGGATQAGTSYTFSDVQAAHTMSFKWTEQFWIAFGQSGVGSDFAGTVITIDGASYGRNGASFWWDSQSTHGFSFLSPLTVNASARYVWSMTTGLSSAQSSSSFQVTGSGSITGNYYEALTPPQLVAGVVGITGFKLLFRETMNNTLSVPATVYCCWGFIVTKWNGTRWVYSGINGSSPSVAYTINALTTVNLPYYVYVLNSTGPSAVAWGEWLKVSFTFHLTFGSSGYSSVYTAELNVHPGDIAGPGAAPITFPYLGADGAVNLRDLTLIALNYLKTVPAGTDPTSALARADINGDGSVNLKDLTWVALAWLRAWRNTPPQA